MIGLTGMFPCEATKCRAIFQHDGGRVSGCRHRVRKRFPNLSFRGIPSSRSPSTAFLAGVTCRVADRIRRFLFFNVPVRLFYTDWAGGLNGQLS
jgi:hypothetical protein